MNYYTAAGIGLGSIGLYVYYYVDVLPYVINTITLYHKTISYFTPESDTEQIKKSHSEINLLCFDTKNFKQSRTMNIQDEITKCNEYDLKLIEKKIDDKIYYKRVYEKDINNLIKDNHFFFGFLDDKPFLQVEFKNKDIKTDIHLTLKPFLIDRNRILDQKFMKWFMWRYFNYKIKNNNYEINIIDNDVSMFELSSNDYMILRNELEKKYELVRNKKI